MTVTLETLGAIYRIAKYFIYADGDLTEDEVKPVFDWFQTFPDITKEKLDYIMDLGEHKLTDAFKQTTYLTDLSPKLFFSREGDRAALYYPDGVIELFDLKGDGSVETMLGQLTQEMSAFGMTEKYLAVCDAGGRLLLYDLEEDRVIRMLNLESPYVRFAFNAEGNLLMGLRQSGILDVYDIPSSTQLMALRSTEAFTDFGFAADGSAAVGLTASGAEVATLWPDEEALIARAREIAG